MNILSNSVSFSVDADQQLAAHQEQATVLLVNEMIAWSRYVDQELNQLHTFTAIEDELKLEGIQGFYIQTQVILNTLNSEPERFHHLSELPGLESFNQEKLGYISNYLSQQGWIEEKVVVTGFLVKLTMKGKLFAEKHNAWV